MSITRCRLSKLGEVPREGNLREEAVRRACVQTRMAMLSRYESSVMRVCWEEGAIFSMIMLSKMCSICSIYMQTLCTPQVSVSQIMGKLRSQRTNALDHSSITHGLMQYEKRASTLMRVMRNKADSDSLCCCKSPKEHHSIIYARVSQTLAESYDKINHQKNGRSWNGAEPSLV